ncbi:MAG: hypothetical protein ACTHY1_03570, partial [Lactobacillus helveticus]
LARKTKRHNKSNTIDFAKMYLNPNETYTSPDGRPFTVTGVGKVPNSGKWVDRTRKYHWKVDIKYLDGKRIKNEVRHIIYDHDDKIYTKLC